MRPVNIPKTLQQQVRLFISGAWFWPIAVFPYLACAQNIAQYLCGFKISIFKAGISSQNQSNQNRYLYIYSVYIYILYIYVVNIEGYVYHCLSMSIHFQGPGEAQSLYHLPGDNFQVPCVPSLFFHSLEVHRFSQPLPKVSEK